MRMKYMKRLVMILLLMVCVVSCGSAVMAAGNKLVLNKEYENYTLSGSSLIRKHVTFTSDGFAECGVDRYTSNKKIAYDPVNYLFYQGKRYYSLGGRGIGEMYEIKDSDILMNLHVDNGEGKKVCLEVKWRIMTDGSLKIVESPSADYKAGEVYKLPSKEQTVKAIITLAKTKVTANGKAQKPKVTVTYAGEKLSSKYYSVSYSSNKYPGVATVTVKGKGAYKSKIATTKLNFIITPAKMKTPAVKAGKALLKVSCKTLKKVSGYEIQISTKKTFASDVKKLTTTSGKAKKVTGLKAKKTYYVKTRAYKIISGTKYYGNWSNIKKVKTK